MHGLLRVSFCPSLLQNSVTGMDQNSKYTLMKKCYNEAHPPDPSSFWHFLNVLFGRVPVENIEISESVSPQPRFFFSDGIPRTVLCAGTFHSVRCCWANAFPHYTTFTTCVYFLRLLHIHLTVRKSHEK